MVAGVRWVALGWVLEMGEPGACHRQMRKKKADDTGTRDTLSSVQEGGRWV